MVTVSAQQKFIRQTPRKVQIVAKTIKNLPVMKAVEILAPINRKASIVVLKVLNQAVANAKNLENIDISTLKVKTVMVNKGPIYKRWRPVSRGRAHSILKRTCHLTIVLEGQELSKQELEQNKKKKNEDLADKLKKAKASKKAEKTGQKKVKQESKTTVKKSKNMVKSKSVKVSKTSTKKTNKDK